MPKLTLELTDGQLDALGKLAGQLMYPSFEALLDYLVDKELRELEFSRAGELAAAEIETALDSVLEPMVALTELVIQPAPEQDSALIESVPAMFTKLRDMTPADPILAEFESQGELAQRACCMVYCKLDDSLWGTETARRLVTSTLRILNSVGAIDKAVVPGG